MMKFALLVLAMIVAVTCAALTEEQNQFLFTKFVENYDKSYETAEFFKKYETFKSNLQLIIAHNARKESFTMGVNQFADLTPEEYVNQLVGFKSPLMKPQGVQEELEKMIALPTTDYIDWTEYLPAVKNQASCGSCWAFSTVGQIEGAYSILNGGKVTSLSEQQLVDCSKQNDGCNGGIMRTAVEDIVGFGGLCKQEDYPYTGRDGTCQKSCQQIVKPAGYKYLPTYTTAAHQVALESGPIAIAVDASSSAFQFYSGGVVSSCKFSGYNHAVLMTGANNVEGTFTIRNSWGASWGAKGYITFKQSDSKNVNCGVGTCEEDGQVYF